MKKNKAFARKPNNVYTVVNTLKGGIKEILFVKDFTSGKK